jgi:hypothetical protein
LKIVYPKICAAASLRGMLAELVVHHLAVARPVNRGPGSDHRESIGDIIDGQLAVDRWQVLERLLHDCLERFGAICAPRLDSARASPGLPDVKGEGHRVAHLTGLRQRREKLGGGKINPQIGLSAAALHERACCIEARLIRVDQGRHGPEGGSVSFGALGRGGKIEQPARFRVHDADLGASFRPIGRKLHVRSSLAFRRFIYDPGFHR